MLHRSYLSALSAVLAVVSLSACTAGNDTAKNPGSPSPASIDYSAWALGRSTPVSDPIYPKYGNASIDVLHYGLDLTWAKDTKTLTGTATIQVRAVSALSTISLDFSPAYTIDGATIDGAAATATVTDGDLTVQTPVGADQAVTLVVRYHGTPATVPMPSKRGDVEALGLTVTADGELWAMQEPYGSSTWYPSNDSPSDKALYDIAVTAPAGWSAVASGTPRGQDGNTFRYSSADPVASYLTTLAVGPFTQETVTGPHNLPITYWYQPGDEAMMTVIRKSPSQIEWLERRFGPYPFPSAGVALVPSNSGMETQQMITLGAKLAKAGANAMKMIDANLFHEYAHQWFGDAVTPADWKDLWLSEGFATYIQYLYTMERDSMTVSAWERWARSADASLRAELGPPGSPSPEHFAESNVYVCPAVMLHEIHKQIGDDAFFAMARDWAQRNRGTTQTRATFTAFVNQHTGKDFTALINAWLDSPKTPGMA